MNTDGMMIYVCDECGYLETIAAVPKGGEWTCGNDSCASHRAWEFPPDKSAAASHHAVHIIMRGRGKGSIFRHATRAL